MWRERFEEREYTLHIREAQLSEDGNLLQYFNNARDLRADACLVVFDPQVCSPNSASPDTTGFRDLLTPTLALSLTTTGARDL